MREAIRVRERSIRWLEDAGHRVYPFHPGAVSYLATGQLLPPIGSNALPQANAAADFVSWATI